MGCVWPIDLSAVAPPGIGGIEVTDTARERGGTICYGALGVGGVKMKIHKAALRRLFTANDRSSMRRRFSKSAKI